MASRSSDEGGGRRWLTAGLCFLLCAAPIAQAPDRGRTEALARRAAERLQALQHEADRLASEEETVLGDLRKLEVERQIRAEQFREVDAQLRQVSTDLTSTIRRAQSLEEQDQAQRPGLKARLVEMYKLGQGRYTRLLLSTADVRSIGAASRTVAALAELDRQRIAAHQRTLADLGTARTDLERRRGELEKLRTQADRARVAAERAAQARNDLIRDIDRRRDLNAQLAGELESAQQRLQAQLRTLAAGESAGDAAALPIKPFRGDLPWPVDGLLRRRFGSPTAPRGGASNGVEIAATEGAPVQAIHEGTVAFAATFSGFGNLVILDHGAQTFSLYGNLLDIAVKRGAHVDRGQQLGSIGPTPTGPAGLYFELRVDGRAVDPLQWLKKR